MRLTSCILAVSIMLWDHSGVAFARVDFVQITDPHLFDADEEGENAAALRACIIETNACLAHGAQYRFAVLTGDLGVEKLVKPDRKSSLHNIPDEKERLKAGAKRLAEILSLSKILVWLVLPGNNDLIDEAPGTITYYQAFVTELQASEKLRKSRLQVVDLTPYLNDAGSGIHIDGGFAFIGFNNASFKANGRKENMEKWEEHHRDQLVLVERRLDKVADGVRAAYIFYHIPEVDDPYFLGLSRINQPPKEKENVLDEWFQKKGVRDDDPLKFSGWAVTPQVRAHWDTIVTNSLVKGLFAGHLHDYQRNTYRSFDWLQTRDYSAVKESKLYICPPIAVKRQVNDTLKARGFRVVSIADDGRVFSEIVWYQDSTFLSDSGRPPCSRLGPQHAATTNSRTLQEEGAIDDVTAKPKHVANSDSRILNISNNRSSGMFGSTALDIAIGLIFVYLLLSLLCSAINEGLEAWTNTRAANLYRGLRELLAAETDKGELVTEIYKHPLVNGLFKGEFKYGEKKRPGWTGRLKDFWEQPNVFIGTNLPAYIPAQIFALAIMDIVHKAEDRPLSSGAAGATPPKDISSSTRNARSTKTLRDAVNGLNNIDVQCALRPLIDAAGNDASQVRKNIEAWYNSAMDRVAGWYKKRVQLCIYMIGIVVVVLLNADTLAILNSLSRDQGLRDGLVVAAAVAPDNSAINPPDVAGKIAGQNTHDNLKEINKPLARLESLGLPIGWNKAEFPKDLIGHAPFWFHKVLGLMMTVFAISLGAPFWFDLLNKFMVIRSTIKPHEKSPEEKSRG